MHRPAIHAFLSWSSWMRSVPWRRWPRPSASSLCRTGAAGWDGGALLHAKWSSAAFCFAAGAPLLCFVGPLSLVSRPSQPELAAIERRFSRPAALASLWPWPAIAPASHLVVDGDGRVICNLPLPCLPSCPFRQHLTFSASSRMEY